MTQAKQPLIGRMAREAARMRSHRALGEIVDRLIEQDMPWFSVEAVADPEQGHDAFCALQQKLVQEARSKAEAALLNDILHDRIDRHNTANPGREIAAPGTITAVFSKHEAWDGEDIVFLQEARAIHSQYADLVDHHLSWQSSVHQLFGLCLGSAIFDSACLNARDLQLFAEWLLDPQSNIEQSDGLPLWVDLKERAGEGLKSRPLRIASGKDAGGLYRLRRLFLAPRSLQLIAQFWAQPLHARSAVVGKTPMLEAITFALGYRLTRIRRLAQLLRGAALLCESRRDGPSHMLISLARRDIQSFAATPGTWRRSLADAETASPITKPHRVSKRELAANPVARTEPLRHSILQSSAFLQFYMAIHDINVDAADEHHVSRSRSRAGMAEDLRRAQKTGIWPDVLCLLSEWYLHLLEYEGLRPSSVERYDDTLGLRLCQTVEDLSLVAISADDLEDIYVEVLEGDQRSVAERLNLARRLRSFHDFAMNSWNFPEIDREIFSMDGDGFTMRVRATAISAKDLKRALDLLEHAFALPPDLARTLQAAFVMASRCGLRIGEICKAMHNHLEHVEGDPDLEQLATLFIRGSRYGSNKTANALGQIRPFLLLDDEEKAIFENWLAYRRSFKLEGPLFGIAQRGGTFIPFDRAAVGRIFAQAIRLATGLEGLSAHDLRRAALNNVALALAENADPCFSQQIGDLTGWISEQRRSIAQGIAGASSREKWEALARFAGHGSPETTFTHYIVHADLLLYYGCALQDNGGVGVESVFDQLGARLIRQPQTAVAEFAREERREEIADIASPAMALQIALECLDRGLPILRAAAAAQLSVSLVTAQARVAESWSALCTSRGQPRLRKPEDEARLLPAKLTKPQLMEALELADLLIEMAATQPEAIKNWILPVLMRATQTNAGVTFRDRSEAEEWLEIAQTLRPASRWQFDRISPDLAPEDRRYIEQQWQGVRPSDMLPATRRVPNGASVQVRLRLLAPNLQQRSSRNPAKSWAGCITVAAHYAAIWLQIPAEEERQS